MSPVRSKKSFSADFERTQNRTSNGMELKEYKKLQQEEKRFFWHIGRRVLIEKLLKKFTPTLTCLPADPLKILDLGCGTGGNFRLLSRFGEVINCDVEAEALRFARRRFPKARWVRADALNLPFASGKFDLLTAFDVLEHIKGEKRALQEWGRVLKAGGLLFLTVPAYQWLWSGHDVVLHHQRRYTAPDLKKLLLKYRFRPVFLTYWVFTLFPLVIAQRMLNRQKIQDSYLKLPPWLNRCLALILSFDGWLAARIPLPWGSTVAALAVKEKVR